MFAGIEAIDFKKSENSFSISAEISAEMKVENSPMVSTVHYEVFANNGEDCDNYVNALNHISQLVKCKILFQIMIKIGRKVY